MCERNTMYIKNKFKKALILYIVLALVLITNIIRAAVVSDNDGSAFVTKAEFETLKDDFAKQVENYNLSIDGKIDGAIASYLAGLRLANFVDWEWLFDNYYEREMKTFKPNAVANIQPIIDLTWVNSIAFNTQYIGSDTVRLALKFDSLNETDGAELYVMKYDEDRKKYIISKNREKVLMHSIAYTESAGASQNAEPSNPTYYYFGRGDSYINSVDCRYDGNNSSQRWKLPYSIRYGKSSERISSWDYTNNHSSFNSLSGHYSDSIINDYTKVTSYKYEEKKINRIVKNTSTNIEGFNDGYLYYWPDTSNFASSATFKLHDLMSGQTYYKKDSSSTATMYKYTILSNRSQTSENNCSRPYLFRLFKHSDYVSTSTDYSCDCSVEPDECEHLIKWVIGNNEYETYLPMTQIALGINNKSSEQQCTVDVSSNVKSCKVFYYSNATTFTEKDPITLKTGVNTLKFKDSKNKLIVIQFEYASTSIESAADTITFSNPVYVQE